MKRRFLGLSFQYKIILALLLMINLSFLATGYLAKTFIESTLMEGKEAKLLALAQVLNARLGDGGYKAILEKHGAASAPRDEQIAVLNAALRAQTDEVAESVPGLGVGYYSRALEAIVTYGPSESFGKSVGVRIPDDHPGRLVMRLNRPMVKIGTMVRGDIMNAMCPIERDGEVIGYIWANELTDDIMSQFAAMNRRLIVFMTACFLATMGLLLLLSRRTMKGIENIMSGVKAMRSDLSARIEDNGGDLGEVAASINAMAEDIEKANTETRPGHHGIAKHHEQRGCGHLRVRSCDQTACLRQRVFARASGGRFSGRRALLQGPARQGGPLSVLPSKIPVRRDRRSHPDPVSVGEPSCLEWARLSGYGSHGDLARRQVAAYGSGHGRDRA